MYPRFSETFIVNEILAHEAAGVPREIFSLRPPADGRFHANLALVRAPVTYLPTGLKATTVWEALDRARRTLPGLWGHMDALTSVAVDDAVQSIELAVLVAQRGIEHLHAHFGSVATTVARLAARLAGVPYSFTAHAKDIFHDDVDPADLRAKVADAALTVTVSDFNLAYLRRTIGAAPDRLERVYNGVDLVRFRYGAPADRPRDIVAVGRLVEKKGFADLIDACARLRDADVAFRCRIVGTGPEEAALRGRIAEHRLADRVELLGARPQDDVVALVGAAAVLAAPCLVGADGNRDGLPTVLLEAMALGTCCVATPVTGIPEAVQDGLTGLLVPQSRPDELADALRRLLDDAPLRIRLAAAARRRAETHFDVHRQTAVLRAGFAAATAGTAGTRRQPVGLAR
ncbi:MAG: glycosyltransferase [Egibacteraceae bacterium]